MNKARLFYGTSFFAFKNMEKEKGHGLKLVSPRQGLREFEDKHLVILGFEFIQIFMVKT